MTIEKFPDVIYKGGRHFHLVTPESRRWVLSETAAKSLNEIDEHMDINNPGRVVKKMDLDLTVRCEVDPPPDEIPPRPFRDPLCCQAPKT